MMEHAPKPSNDATEHTQRHLAMLFSMVREVHIMNGKSPTAWLLLAVGTLLAGLWFSGCAEQVQTAAPADAEVAAITPPGEQSPAEPSGEQAATKFRLTSSAFDSGGPIPRKYTGDGENVSPPLAWEGVPEGTKELALVCDDPDAPSPRRPAPKPWVHWIIYKIPPTESGLPEAVPSQPRLDSPAGALQGKNSWPTVGYRGPEPPPGSGRHRYVFKLYALDAHLALSAEVDKDALLEAMQGHVLAETQLIGTYER